MPLPRAKPTAIRAVRALDRDGSLSQNALRRVWGVSKSVRDSLIARQLVTSRWSSRENRWHYRWPEGRVKDPGRWNDAQGWATYGFYYGMDDLLWRKYRPQSGDVVIDVGAGHGGETLYLAHMVGPKGKVLAVEASPATFERLEELCQLNRWPQVEPIQTAVSSESGFVTMSSEKAWIAGNIYEGGDVEVRATTIDDLCADRGITQVDWIKMNIEGAERDALVGMERMAPHVRNLTISCHDFLGTEWGQSLDFVMTWLRDHGFQVEQRNEGDMVQRLYVYAWR